MARKTLGFVNLVWTCPSCTTQNPGPIRSCTSCGAPQPAEIQFEEVDQSKFELIKDEALIRMAKAGPDKHCPYCGTRNKSTEDLCVECGGDISTGALLRKHGDKIRSPQEAPSTDAAPRKKMSKGCLTGLIITAVITGIGLIILLILSLQSETVSAKVTDVKWELTKVIESYTSVEGRDWYDEIPEGAELVSCSSEYRYTSDEPVANATETCSEPYTIDTGTGVGKLVQDCTYRVYDDFCVYTGYAWVVTDTLVTSGYDLSPYEPEATLSSTQRVKELTENYTIYFASGSDQYSYAFNDYDLFSYATIGSTWDLEVNGFGSVTSATP